MSVNFMCVCVCVCMYSIHTHTHTHTHKNIYIGLDMSAFHHIFFHHTSVLSRWSHHDTTSLKATPLMYVCVCVCVCVCMCVCMYTHTVGVIETRRA